MRSKNIDKSIILYVLLAFAILGPALKPGYIFLLDMPWPVRFQLSDYLQSGLGPQLAAHTLLSVLNVFIPAWLLQKLVLLTLLSGIGVSTKKLTSYIYLRHFKFGNIQATWAAVLSGILAMLNPFVFERLAAGQWIVLAGYAYTPFVVLMYLKHRNTKPFWITYALFPLISIHFWLMVSVIGGISLVVSNRSALLALLRSVKLYAWFFVLNAYWVISLFLGNNQQAESLNRNDFMAFQTLSDPNVGILGNVVSLHGMWAASSSLLKDTNRFWFAYALCLLALSLFGMYQYRLKKRQKVAVLVSACALLLAFIVAIGVASPITQAILTPFSYLPFATALRESAKAIGIIALIYAVWTPIGLISLATNEWSKTALKGAFVLHIIMMSGMFWGLNGTLKNFDYPSDWYKVAYSVPSDSKALVIPWQGYLELEFADNVYAANPARVFFPFKTVQSTSTGNQLIDEQGGEIRTLLNSYLDQDLGYQALAQTLVNDHKITHIIILKTGNWQRYQPLIDEATGSKSNVENLSEITSITL